LSGSRVREGCKGRMGAGWSEGESESLALPWWEDINLAAWSRVSLELRRKAREGDPTSWGFRESLEVRAGEQLLHAAEELLQKTAY